MESNNDSTKYLRLLTLAAFIFFEVYAGVRLLTNPVEFTNRAIIVFGVVMIIIGIVSLIRSLKAKSAGLPYTLGLVGAIFDLVIGVICIFLSSNIVALFPFLAMIYGVIMVIFGINKIRQYAILHDIHMPNVWILLIAGILSIVLGVIVFLHPFETTELLWAWTGYFLIFEGVFDLFALIFSFFM